MFKVVILSVFLSYLFRTLDLGPGKSVYENFYDQPKGLHF